MKSAQKRKKTKSTDPFSFFQKAALNSFSFLIADYGFELISTNIHIPECAIRYRNKTTSVIVFYEWGAGVWVDLGRLKHTPEEIAEVEMYSLDLLIIKRCPEKIIKQDFDFQQHSEMYIQKVTDEYADALQKCGDDVLTGDFRVFQKLKSLAKDEEHRVNKELYGSKTGEIRIKGRK